jgi:hypothetical protein
MLEKYLPVKFILLLLYLLFELHFSCIIKMRMTWTFLPNFYASLCMTKMAWTISTLLISFPSYQAFCILCYDVTGCA